MCAYGISTILGDRGQEFTCRNKIVLTHEKENPLNYYEIFFSELSSVMEYLVVGSGAHQMIRYYIGNVFWSLMKLQLYSYSGNQESPMDSLKDLDLELLLSRIFLCVLNVG